MHGWVALKFGDSTAQRAGRLTLNPIPHIDIFGTILLPALLLISQAGIIFGWAKPVPVNPLNFSDLRKGELLVSVAGVLSNFFLAILGAILFHLFLPILGSNHLLIDLIRFMVTINLILGIFNLLPIPPLDGSKVLMSQLPLNLAKEYEKITPYGIIIILILWFIPIGNTSALSFILRFGITTFNSVLNVPLRLF